MLSLGIDLGGTFARAAVVEASGRLVSAAKTALQNRSPEGVVATIHAAAVEAMKAAGNPAVSACGVGVAGQLEGDHGVIAVAPNLGWRNVPFGKLLSDSLGRPVRLINDLRAAAWGEFVAGAGQGCSDMLVVFVGSGVGSAIISGGRLVVGASNVAGEFGHVKVVTRGRSCGCGEQGCLEAYAGGHNLIAQMREAVAGGPTALAALCSGNPSVLTPAHLEEAAEMKDGAALAIIERAGDYLALAVANYVTVMNPTRLVLGGGVLTHAPTLRRRVTEGIAAYTNASARRAVHVVTAALGDDAGIIGAGLLATAK
ncbi:MAG: ROK family protein [Myxococcaceae bacterium]